MKIVMMTNTYTPHVGGVARSVTAFTEAYRARGHEVLVVAPEFHGRPAEELDVIRIPAIQNFNGSDFSVVLPMPGYLVAALDDFAPDIIHSHHPFLVGSTALRAAASRDCPLVFTHHTMYERYTHYVPGDSPVLRRFVVELSTSYANQCDCVFAPSESIAGILRERGVEVPLEVVPTGIDLPAFASGDGAALRRGLGIPEGAYVVGHVGRLAAEKNLRFLARSLVELVERRPQVHLLVVGEGPAEEGIVEVFEAGGLGAHLHLTGKLVLRELADAYHAMDCFAFASTSETQGLVLAEAMAAGLPVVAIDAPGAREVVSDGRNGLLLSDPDNSAFAEAVARVMDLDPAERDRWHSAIAETARAYSMQACVDKALGIYARLAGVGVHQEADPDPWRRSLQRIKAEWDLLRGVARAAGAAANLGLKEPKEPG